MVLTFLAGASLGVASTLIALAVLVLVQRSTIRTIEDYCDRLIDAAAEPTEPSRPKGRPTL